MTSTLEVLDFWWQEPFKLSAESKSAPPPLTSRQDYGRSQINSARPTCSSDPPGLVCTLVAEPLAPECDTHLVAGPLLLRLRCQALRRLRNRRDVCDQQSVKDNFWTRRLYGSVKTESIIFS